MHVRGLHVYNSTLRAKFLLLSSDGLHDYVKKERIQEIVLLNWGHVEKSVKELVGETRSAGSDDNIMAMLAYGADENRV